MSQPQFRYLGLCDYESIWHQMRSFTLERTPLDPDEFWFLEHTPVYTQGLNGNPIHVRHQTEVPVIRTDRGGQITWHGPGQLISYTLLDLQRLGIGIRTAVQALESAAISLLLQFGIHAHLLPGAPGVYVNQQKIASIGLKVTRGCCYHGIALNVCPDLIHFDSINPCGYENLSMTSLLNLGVNTTPTQIAPAFAAELLSSLYSTHLRS